MIARPCEMPAKLDVGTLVVDAELGDRDPNPAVVIEYADERASDHHIEEIGETVSEVNPSYPENDRVAVIAFANDLTDEIGEFWDLDIGLIQNRVACADVTTYSYPQSRLEPLLTVITTACSRCGYVEPSYRVEAPQSDNSILLYDCPRCGFREMAYELTDEDETEFEETGWSA